MKDMAIDKEIDRIFDLVNDLCWDSNWDEIDRLLEEAEKQKSVCLRLSWLTITACVKSKLKNREAYFKNTEELVKDDPKRDGLLMGLE